jgi:hypothetical protein
VFLVAGSKADPVVADIQIVVSQAEPVAIASREESCSPDSDAVEPV